MSKLLHSSFLIFLLIFPCGALPGQEFEFGIEAPPEIRRNSTIEALFTISSSGIPTGRRGAQGWSLSAPHQGFTILSMTTSGTVVDELFDGGFLHNEVTSSSPERPLNDGFFSAVILAMSNPEATLPPQGMVTVARARYHVGALACFEGASLSIRDGLQGGGAPVKSAVTWDSRTFLPRTSQRVYPACVPNDYALHVQVAESPLEVPLGERRRFLAEVRLAQMEATAAEWSFALAHDSTRLRIIGVTAEGTGLEELLEPGGYVQFEITSGPGNEGIAARTELSMEPPRALPAPEGALLFIEYETLPLADPSLPGTRIETALRFVDSLQGSGGRIRNEVFPEGNLSARDFSLGVDVLSPTRFIRGDANGDGEVDISDPITVLFHLYGGLEDLCLEGGNSNDDSRLDLTDAIFSLERIFLRPAPFPAPSPACGPDPTLPALGCLLPCN